MKRCFEGWYFRHQQGRTLLSVIAGRSGEGAFVQVLTDRASYYAPYPAEAFSHEKMGSSLGVLRIGENHLSPNGLTLSIRTPDLRLTGELGYSPWTPPAYDIMGPFRCLPMECRHSVFSLLHRVDGQVSVNGALLGFDGGAGYAEGDQGRSFPSQYAWFQWCELETQRSVMISVAKIPFAGLRFWGVIAVVWLDGREHRLATYLGAKIRRLDERHITLAQGKWTLEAEVLGQEAHPLRAPDKGSMSRVIRESAGAPARIRFGEKGKTLLATEDALAGHEYV